MKNDVKNDLPFNFPHSYLPFTVLEVYDDTRRIGSFTFDEIYLLYSVYFKCGYIPIFKPGPGTSQERIDMYNFIVLCMSKNIDTEKLANKVESWSKWNKSTRELFKSISSHYK